MSLELEEKKVDRLLSTFQNIINVDILTQNQNTIFFVYKNFRSTYQITPP